MRDPVFEKLQFEQWAGKGETRIKWSVEVPPAELSTHQRLMLRVVTKIDGRELEKRRGEGAFIAMLQITDAAGLVWQNHTPIDLGSLAPNVQSQEFFVTHYAFVLPGEYVLTIAVCDTKTLEHSVSTRKLRVEGVKDDPLPRAFDGLPAVEFVPPTDGTPDVWFLPGIAGKLKLELAAKHRLEVQVLVNLTPSERQLGSAGALRRNMSLAMPALTHTLRIRNRERLVVCSDGFASQCEHGALAQLVADAASPLEPGLAQAWCDAARDAGSQDDITVLIVERHDQFTPLARISLAVATALVAGAAALAWSLA